MSFEWVRIEREELYEMVWKKPITALAKEYGLSYGELRTLCTRMNIPRPPNGYHSRTVKEEKTPLPPAGDHDLFFNVNLGKKYLSEIDGVINTKNMPEIEFEKKLRDRIVVAKRLISPHPLVQSMAEKIYGEKKNRTAGPDSSVDSGSFVYVTVKNINRALKIADALLKALETRGYQVSKELGFQYYVTVLNVKIHISLKEHSKQVPHIPTDEELRRHRQYSWLTFPKYDYVNSGELYIKLDGRRSQAIISDKTDTPLEAQLNTVMMRMQRLAVRLHNDKVEAEQRKRECIERNARREQFAKRQEQEKAKLEKLHTDSEQWHTSQRLRAYIEAARQKAIQTDGGFYSGSGLADWVAWAHRQADRIDPLVESPYSILDDTFR